MEVTISKKAVKAEKLRRRQEDSAATASGFASVSIDGPDPLAANYGDVSIESELVSGGRVRTPIGYVTDELKDHMVFIRGHVQTIRAVGKKIMFLTVRRRSHTIQCVLTVAKDVVSAQMVKYASAISKESCVHIEGIIRVPPEPIIKATQQVEVHVRKIYCVDRATPVLPINVEDAARSEAEIEKALEAEEPCPRVNIRTGWTTGF